MPKRPSKEEYLAAFERADEIIHTSAPRIASADPETSDHHLREVYAVCRWLVGFAAAMVERHVE